VAAGSSWLVQVDNAVFDVILDGTFSRFTAVTRVGFLPGFDEEFSLDLPWWSDFRHVLSET